MAGSWLIDDGRDRARVLDMDRRIAPVRRRSFAILAVALVLCGPWLGWWTLAPLIGAAFLFAATDRLVPLTERPELALFAAWGGAEAIIAISVAISGGPDVATLSWLAIPIVTLASRFSQRGVVAGVAIALALLFAVAFGSDAAAVVDEPTLVIAPAALIISMAMLSTALMRSDFEYRDRSVIDPLTGMLNRAALDPRMLELRQQSEVRGDPVGLVLADVDRFKRVNDSHGHGTGDAVLRDIAYRLRKRTRAFDLAYRVGGDEFVLILPGSDAAAALALADQLCAAIADERFGDVEVTLSCGVAASSSGATFVYADVFAAADTALYEAKHDGRNRVRAAGGPPRSTPFPHQGVVN
jgi:diguanylate cyclase (GGDEF)-like protein